ncbi:hypothetical protein [Tsuneonella sp. HG222]
MPTKYFAGNSLAALTRTNVAMVETTLANRFNSSFVSSGLTTGGTTGAFATATFAATGTVWLKFDIWFDDSRCGRNFFTLYNGSTGVFRLNGPTSTGGITNIVPEYWNGTAWTATGSAFSLAEDSLLTLAIRVDLNSGFEVFLAGTSVSTGSGWSGGQTSATHAAFQSPNSTSYSYIVISQIMVADYDIRDCRFLAAALNGNSASNTGAATGTYTDINETVLDDSTSLTVTAAGNKAGQVFADITLPPGYIIGAMVINGRGRVNGTIADGKLGVRGSSGTNSSGSGMGYNGGYEPRCRIITADPDTGTNFTQSGFNASEIYEEAV